MRRTCTIILLATLIISSFAVPAYASPLSDKQAEAERAREAVAALDIELEIAVEDYNEAYEAYAALSAQVAEAEACLEDLKDQILTLETHLSARVDAMYRTGPLGFLEVLLGANSFSEFVTVWDLLTDISSGESVEVSQLREARAEAERLEADLQAARDRAKAEADEMAARKAEVESKLAERQGILAGIEDEVARLDAAERARQEAAAAAARARSSYTSRGSSGGAPTRAPRSEVVAIAKRYLGAPYRWGASGPDAFDCSGFTMYVYAQVGVSLPHSSRAQYQVGERVSRANLRPGDLVFFGRSRIHHVGIYVGSGEYIHAPHTGDVVRIAPLNRSDYAGAVRP